ncbi:MAG: hypothetical protein VZR73_06320 [Acutalibacteraceae bacterium]|nr:hypothetical protein [Acutalibacteraceae bacterium]
MEQDMKRQEAIQMLVNKAQQLQEIPKRSDFSGDEVCFIKQKLGPWPRALEAAGLKEPPAVSAQEKSRLKREKRRLALKQLKKASDSSEKTG